MNTLQNIELRRSFAIATASIAGMVGLTGCAVSLSGPDMKQQDKAKFQKALKPEAVKAARRVVEFLKEDQREQGYLTDVSRDYSVPNGYNVIIDGLAKDSPRMEFHMKGTKQNGSLVLQPETTYYAEDESTTGVGKDLTTTDVLISYTEEGASGVYHRDVWYAESYFANDENGVPKSSSLASTHVDSPRSEDEINQKLSYASEVAQGFAEGVIADIQVIKDSQNN